LTLLEDEQFPWWHTRHEQSWSYWCPEKITFDVAPSDMISKPRITWSECYWHSKSCSFGELQSQLWNLPTSCSYLVHLVGSNQEFWFQLVNTEPELGLIVRTSWFWNQNWAIFKTGLGTGFLVLFIWGTRTNTRIFFQNNYRTKSKLDVK
jgi:hypothetical protein